MNKTAATITIVVLLAAAAALAAWYFTRKAKPTEPQRTKPTFHYDPTTAVNKGDR